MPPSVPEALGLAVAQAPFSALLFAADDDLTLLWRNSAHERMTGSQGLEVAGRGMFDVFPPSDDEGGSAAMRAIRDAVDAMRRTRESVDIGPYRYDLRRPDGTFEEHHWRMQMSPVVEDGEVTAFLQVAQDATQEVLNKRLADTLRRAAASTAGVSHFAYDPETDHFERTPAVDEMFGFAPGEAGDLAAPFFARVHPDDLGGVNAEVERVFAAPRGEVAAFDYRVPQPDGSERFVRIRAEVAVDPTDRREKLVGTFVDLTDLEMHRRELERGLKLRQTLVREANHRIKNSLAIALAMLRIEKHAAARAGETTTADAMAMLSGLEARISAISSAHGVMQLDDDSTDVSLHALLEALAAHTRATSGIGDANLRLRKEGEDRRLTSDVAINLGIVLNEFLTNALKYGMNADGSADIEVTVAPAEAATDITIENRIERSEPIEAVASTRLGSALVSQLAEALGARIEAGAQGDVYHAGLRLPD